MLVNQLETLDASNVLLSLVSSQKELALKSCRPSPFLPFYEVCEEESTVAFVLDPTKITYLGLLTVFLIIVLKLIALYLLLQRGKAVGVKIDAAKGPVIGVNRTMISGNENNNGDHRNNVYYIVIHNHSESKDKETVLKVDDSGFVEAYRTDSDDNAQFMASDDENFDKNENVFNEYIDEEGKSQGKLKNDIMTATEKKAVDTFVKSLTTNQ